MPLETWQNAVNITCLANTSFTAAEYHLDVTIARILVVASTICRAWTPSGQSGVTFVTLRWTAVWRLCRSNSDDHTSLLLVFFGLGCLMSAVIFGNWTRRSYHRWIEEGYSILNCLVRARLLSVDQCDGMPVKYYICVISQTLSIRCDNCLYFFLFIRETSQREL